MLGLVIEQTGLSGETIGTAYRTILTRITKASAVDGTSAEDISKAEESLKAVGVQVRQSAGEFRDMTDIMHDLGDVWGDLDDVQQSNISFQIAGTRQTNIIKTLLANWEEYESLVQKAGDSAGTTMENQEKHAESYKGELQELSATAESFWNNFLNSSTFKTGTNFLTGILSILDKISGTMGTLGTISLGAGLFAGIRNFGGHKILEPHKTIVLKLPNIISVLWDTKVFLWSNVKYTG
jgi:TP901 family phage tail tape measure protein